ncbi:MAG: 23S rRNA (adenine(2503)-C(2))-methyltransferase RlmN [Candidatus Shapirobacteria bacterium]|jgi:23S rRNA (adenine2503-C2)-methyltransferase
MDLSKVETFLKNNNLPLYRLKQIRKNYFSGRFSSFDDMTDLPLSLRKSLSANFSLLSVITDKTETTGSTQKALLNLVDNQKIESVLMDYDGWLTACVSSQVGCPLNCSFCATGRLGYKRNLSAEELVDQILYWNTRLFPKYIGRIVFMGMGEPFLNWDNLISALKIINSKDGLGIGARKISISTAGIINRIYDFTNLNTEINLAISLHSVNQKIREHIMPIAKQYPLRDLKKACLNYVQVTKRQLFFEYALMKNINDSPEDAAKLIIFINTNRLYYLNLIHLNPIEKGIVPSDQKTSNSFISILTKSGINFSLRRTFGQSIHAACGQLAGK